MNHDERKACVIAWQREQFPVEFIEFKERQQYKTANLCYSIKEKIADTLYGDNEFKLFKDDIVDYLDSHRYIHMQDYYHNRIGVVYDTTKPEDLMHLLKTIEENGIFVMDPESILYNRYSPAHVMLTNLAVVRETGIGRKDWVNVYIIISPEDEYKKQEEKRLETIKKIADQLYNGNKDEGNKCHIVEWFLDHANAVIVNDKFDPISPEYSIHDIKDLEAMLYKIAEMNITVTDTSKNPYDVFAGPFLNISLQHLKDANEDTVYIYTNLVESGNN